MITFCHFELFNQIPLNSDYIFFLKIFYLHTLNSNKLFVIPPTELLGIKSKFSFFVNMKSELNFNLTIH